MSIGFLIFGKCSPATADPDPIPEYLYRYYEFRFKPEDLVTRNVNRDNLYDKLFLIRRELDSFDKSANYIPTPILPAMILFSSALVVLSLTVINKKYIKF